MQAKSSTDFAAQKIPKEFSRAQGCQVP